MYKRPLVPEEFDVPVKLVTHEFILRTLTVNDLVKDFDAGDYLSPKDVRKTDPFIHYGVAASVEAIRLGDGIRPYPFEWCSFTQIPSKPISAANSSSSRDASDFNFDTIAQRMSGTKRSARISQYRCPRLFDRA